MDHSAVQRELRCAVRLCRDRGLRQSAKWAAELLCALPPAEHAFSTRMRVRGVPGTFELYDTAPGLEDCDDVLALAMSYFETKEFVRALHLLDTQYEPLVPQAQPEGGLPPAPRLPWTAKALFVRCYAQYLEGERRKEMQRLEKSAEMLAREEPVTNPFLLELLGLLAPLYAAGKAGSEGAEGGATGSTGAGASGLDAFCTYLYGVVLRGLGRTAEARDALLSSVHAYPLNWSAWLDLCTLVADDAVAAAPGGAASAILSLPLPLHWASDLFRAHALVEVQANAAALKLYRSISAAFPGSSYLKAQVGRALYNLRQFEAAQSVFAALRKTDPHRLEDIDTLSNILYVKGDRSGLSEVAHKAFLLDRSRPDACCAIGNYYSLRGEHEKAVLYFRRALRLSPSYAAAWTLMGHEYLELRNTPAAIESYRRAADLNPRDYRAWYGLGQTYEILQMYVYAAYYFKRAAALRPHDARMWCALGQIYENLRRTPQAVACYERAVRAPEGDRLALLRLARLHRSSAEGGSVAVVEAAASAACSYYLRYLEEVETGLGRPQPLPSRSAGGGGGASAEVAPAWANDAAVAEALLHLATSAYAEGHLDAAEAYATRVLDMVLPTERTEAQAVLADVVGSRREAQARQAAARGGGGVAFAAAAAAVPRFAPGAGASGVAGVGADPLGLGGPPLPSPAPPAGVRFPAPPVSFGALPVGGAPATFGDATGVARLRPGTFEAAAMAAAAAGGGGVAGGGLAARASPIFRFPAGGLLSAAVGGGVTATPPPPGGAMPPAPPVHRGSGAVGGGTLRGVPGSAAVVTPIGMAPVATPAVGGSEAGSGGGGGNAPASAAFALQPGFEVTPTGEAAGGGAGGQQPQQAAAPAGATRRRTKSALNGSEDLKDLTVFGLPQDSREGASGVGGSLSVTGVDEDDAVGDIFPGAGSGGGFGAHAHLLARAIEDDDDELLAGATLRSPSAVDERVADDDDMFDGDDGPRLTTRFGATYGATGGAGGSAGADKPAPRTVTRGGARRVSAGGGSANASFLFEGVGAGDLSAIPDGSPAPSLLATRFSFGAGPSSTLRSRGAGGGAGGAGSSLFTPDAAAAASPLPGVGGGRLGTSSSGADHDSHHPAGVRSAPLLLGADELTPIAPRQSDLSDLGGHSSGGLLMMMTMSSTGGARTIRGRGIAHLPGTAGEEGGSSSGGGGEEGVVSSAAPPSPPAYPRYHPSGLADGDVEMDTDDA